MNIFVAGGGRVGFHLARLLSAEKHDVTMIESHAGQLEQIDYALDVSTVLGNAASITLLNEINTKDADVFIAVTGADEVNLIAASAAKRLGAKQVVARVHESPYMESSILYEQTLDIDYVLSPEVLVALETAKYIVSSGVMASEDFGLGLVQMRQIRAVRSPTVNGQTLKDICPPGSGVLLGVISRNGHTIIPHGDTIVEPDDCITLIGHRDKIEAIQKLFQHTNVMADNVVIMGGGNTGLHLARALEKRRRSVKLFDHDMSQCKMLAAALHKTKVICRDVTSRTALEQESIAAADVFVATTGDDERNIVTSVLAKEMGVAQTIAVVHQPDFAPLARRLGIDYAVTPRASFANRMLKLVHQGKVSSLAILEEGQVEVLEFAVGGDAPILGARLKDARPKFPSQALVATIQRAGNVIVPSGNDEILAGDFAVVIAAADSVGAVQKLFIR